MCCHLIPCAQLRHFGLELDDYCGMTSQLLDFWGALLSFLWLEKFSFLVFTWVRDNVLESSCPWNTEHVQPGRIFAILAPNPGPFCIGSTQPWKRALHDGQSSDKDPLASGILLQSQGLRVHRKISQKPSETNKISFTWNPSLPPTMTMSKSLHVSPQISDRCVY